MSRYKSYADANVNIHDDPASRILSPRVPDMLPSAGGASATVRAGNFPDIAHGLNLLPEQPMRMIGRGALTDTLLALITRPEIRLITLTGFGGVGKSRLAAEVARRVASSYDLVVFVDLATVEPGEALNAIAGAAGVELRQDQSAVGQLGAWLRPHRALLLLDNSDFAVDSAPQIAQLLTTTRELDVLVTSRQPLRIRWEHVVRVPPLAVPDAGEEAMKEELAGIPAIAAFVDHIQRHRPEFALNEHNSAVIARVCRLVDGLPLALELAAAVLQTCSLHQLCERLESRTLDTLRFNLRDLPARQISMRDAISWSFPQLSTVERRAAAQASIFVGGGTVEAARAVIQLDADAGPVEDLLLALAEKSLLRFDPQESEIPRFSTLRVAREFLRDHLDLENERTELEQRFSAYYGELAARLTSDLDGTNGLPALTMLHQERENFRTVLRSALAGREAGRALRLAGTLIHYWHRSGQIEEADQWCKQLLALCEESEQIGERNAAMRQSGRVAALRGRVSEAASFLQPIIESRDAALTESGDTALTAPERSQVALELARLRLAQGNVAEAEQLLDAVRATLEDQSGSDQLAELTWLRGVAAASRGRHDEARDLLTEVESSTSPDHTSHAGLRAALTLAELGLIEGSLEAAGPRYASLLANASEVGDWHVEVRSHFGLGLIACRNLDPAAALLHFNDGFELSQRCSDELGAALIIDGLSTLGLAHASALRDWLPFAGIADAIYDSLGVSVGSLERKLTAFDRKRIRALVGEEEARLIEADGRQLAVESVPSRLASARADELAQVAEPRRDTVPDGVGVERLTRREREVVQLLSKGLTNRDIALRLDIAERTVDSHVTNIFRKLEVSSRVSVAAWAIEHGLANR